MKKFAVLVAVLVAGCEDSIENFGGLGEQCFPNKTCEAPHTCFNIAERQECFSEIKPVVLNGAKACYTFSGGEGEGVDLEKTRCFDSFDECVKNFALAMAQPGSVVRGCAY